MSASFLSAMNTRAEDTFPEVDLEDDELCEFCGDTDDCLMMCEGCKKSGCPECVKSYIGEHFGDCKECCEKAEFPDGNGWESEVDSDEEMSDDEPMCCVGCGKDGKFPENRDGDTMCECCMSDEEDEDSDDEDSDEE